VIGGAVEYNMHLAVVFEGEAKDFLRQGSWICNERV